MQEERYCWMTAIKPIKSSPPSTKKHQSLSYLQREDIATYPNFHTAESSKDIDQQHQYQKLGQRNESQSYASAQAMNIPRPSEQGGKRDSHYTSVNLENVDEDQAVARIAARIVKALGNCRDSRPPEKIIEEIYYPEIVEADLDEVSDVQHSSKEESRHSYEEVDEYTKPGKPHSKVSAQVHRVREVSPNPLVRTNTSKKTDEAIRKSTSLGQFVVVHELIAQCIQNIMSIKNVGHLAARQKDPDKSRESDMK